MAIVEVDIGRTRQIIDGLKTRLAEELREVRGLSMRIMFIGADSEGAIKMRDDVIEQLNAKMATIDAMRQFLESELIHLDNLEQVLRPGQVPMLPRPGLGPMLPRPELWRKH